MKGWRVLVAQFLAVLVLACATWLAILYSLYWHLWWFDIPMHILGGIWAGLCAAWLVARNGHPFTLVWCLVFAFVVGIAWEIFEYHEGIAMPQYLNYPADTAKDIVMDLFGAVLGFVFARKLQSREAGGE